MGWSFQVCRIAGVPVRVHWAFLLLPLFFLYRPLIERDTDALVSGFINIGFVVAAVLVHEFAHALTARGFGAVVYDITLWPLGGFTKTSGMPSPSAEVVLSIAGPLSNLALGGLAWGIGSLGLSHPFLAWFALLNVILALFNLIPAYPMDGGQALRSALHARIGHVRGDVWAGRVGVAAGGALALFGLAAWGGMFVFIIGLLCVMSSVQLLRQGVAAGYDARPPAPETGDFRAWRLPREKLEAEIHRRRAAERANREMREKVDEILKKVSERGFDSLDDEERSFLKSASERLRTGGR